MCRSRSSEDFKEKVTFELGFADFRGVGAPRAVMVPETLRLGGPPSGLEHWLGGGGRKEAVALTGPRCEVGTEPGSLSGWGCFSQGSTDASVLSQHS